MDEERSPDERQEETRQAHERLALPLLVPAAAFLFAVLVIYGLSRIYLELDTFKAGDVSMATPLAIAVALGILFVSGYLATRPSVPRWQVASIIVFAVASLTGGAIWAAVHEEGEAKEVVAPTETATPAGEETPVAPGAIQVDLVDPDFAVAVEPASASAGSVTFTVTNTGSIVHNLRVIKSDLAPDALPVDEETFAVDESQVGVIASLAELEAGESGELSAELEAGSYVLICNVPTHYDLGMHAAFTVE